MVLGGCPLGDITSDYSGASRAVAKRSSIRNDSQFGSGVKRKDFGLLRLEKQIIALTVDGYSTKETAERIGINEAALGVQLTSIYRKLHVSNQFELILFAVYHQLIDS
jgi:DNA-binding CsgD family transcriptional regulator